ncbi:hypothetical protein BV20DRAFT_698560 [Pilatotrama ljubarskyi]|nr:hypothetical protein BV20DRAFT_698560 [Pilatotrama ljubarskyi]
MSSSAMSATHRCLLVNEIFQVIAEELYENGGQRTLSALARTCKVLHEAVLPVLWNSLDSIVPLLRLFPPDTWSEIQNPDGGNVLRIIKPDALVWTRFNHYAPHVRKLIWKDRSDVSLLALSALSVYRPMDHPLLPELRTLMWCEDRPPYFAFIHLFLSPTIRELGLTSSDFDAGEIMALLDNAARICTQVELVTICTSMMAESSPICTEAIGEAFARFIRATPNLKAFNAELCLTAPCVEALAALPRLEMLDLFIGPKDMEAIAASAARVSSKGCWFPSLGLLALNVIRLDANTKTFLGAIQSPSLLELAITTLRQPDAHMLKQQFEVLARGPWRDTLMTLVLEFEHPRYENAPPPPSLDVGYALQPLYALPELDTFAIRGPSVAVDSSTLRSIANAWSKLEFLSIIGYLPHPPAERCVELEDLVPFARKCPDLHALELHLNATFVPDEAAMTRLLPEPSSSRLRSLTVYEAPISGPQNVADVLERLFPMAHVVDYRGEGTFPEDAQRGFEMDWQEVQKILQCRLSARMATGPEHVSACALSSW